MSPVSSTNVFAIGERQNAQNGDGAKAQSRWYKAGGDRRLECDSADPETRSGRPLYRQAGVVRGSVPRQPACNYGRYKFGIAADVGYCERTPRMSPNPSVS